MFSSDCSKAVKLTAIALLTTAALVSGGPTAARAQVSPIVGPSADASNAPPFASVGACLRISGILADPMNTTNVRVHQVWGSWILGVPASGQFGDTWFNLDRATVVQVFPSASCP
jgi:hypothetical protein